jgi:hypothetical protein
VTFLMPGSSSSDRSRTILGRRWTGTMAIYSVSQSYFRFRGTMDRGQTDPVYQRYLTERMGGIGVAAFSIECVVSSVPITNTL